MKDQAHRSVPLPDRYEARVRWHMRALYQTEAEQEPLALLLVGAAVLIVIFLLMFVLLPAMASTPDGLSTSGTIRDSVTVIAP